MATIDVNGTTIYYESDGTGPGVLFVHGMCGDAEVWRQQADLLSARYRCVRYDRRGYSRSRQGDASPSEMLHADDAASIIEALGLGPCLAIGSSAGANVVLDLLRRHPQLLRGAVVSEPPLFSIAPDLGGAFLAEVQQLVGAAIDAGGPRAAVDAFMSRVCPGLWSKLDETAKDRYRANGETGFRDLAAPKADISAADLAAVSLPVLVIGGEESVTEQRQLARLVADAIPDARYVDIPGSGHVTYAEQPEAFAREVAAFARDLDPVTATGH